MSNIVEFLVKIKDMASSPLASIGNTGNNSFSKLTNGLGAFNAKLNNTGSSVNQLDKKLQDLTRTRNLSVDSSQIRRINAEIDQVQKKKDRLTGAASGTGALGGFLRQGLAIAGIGSLAFMGKDIMQAGIERQMNQTSFEVLLGKKDGNKLNSGLLKFAKDSIYGNEVFNEGKLMAGSGVKANNIMPILKMIGDISMGDKERMKSISLAFSEASSTGKLTGRQNLMFRTALFNPLQQLSEMTKKPVAELTKDMEKGKISINDLVKSMQYATGPAGRWHDMMQKLQEQPSGKWTALTGTLRTLAGTIGLSLMPVLGNMSDFFNGILGDSNKLWAIAAGIGAMAGAWALYTLWTERAAIWQGILQVIAWWPLAAIGAIAGGITYMCLKYESWGKSMQAIWNIAKDLTTGMGLMFKDSFFQIGYFFEYLLLKFESGFEKLIGIFSNFEKAKILALTGNFKQAGVALIAPIHTEAGERLNQKRRENDLTHGANLLAIKKVFGDADMQSKLIHFDTKNPKGLKSPLDILKEKFTPDKANGAADTLGDTTKGITGGGVRNITINVAKFQDKTEIHTATFKEGIADMEAIIENMFLRITNSGASAMN